MGTYTVGPTLPVSQCLKRCISYLSSHPQKPYFILLNIMMAKMSSDLHEVGIKLKITPPRIVYDKIKMRIMQ